jgi:hypothetical protein
MLDFSDVVKLSLNEPRESASYPNWRPWAGDVQLAPIDRLLLCRKLGRKLAISAMNKDALCGAQLTNRRIGLKRYGAIATYVR